MKKRINSLFQRLLEAGSQTTYQGKIRTRGGKRKATVTRGRQRTYKGVRIIPVEDGEYTISIDRDSRFESVRDAKKVIDMMRRNPLGTIREFERCVEAVESRGGAIDPRAVCAAQERKKYGQKELTRRAKAGKRAKAKNPGKKARAERKELRGMLRRSGTSYKHFPARGVSRAEAKYRREESYRRRANPADAAMAVSEEFHGRKVKAMVPVQSKRHYHKYLAELGELRKLVVETPDGRKRVTLTKFDGAILCTSENKRQLFIMDGDQSVNLADFGIRDPHEVETLGRVISIEYFTDKEHLGDEGGTAVYAHKFRSTNDNGKHKTVKMARYPDLIYHLRDEHLEFSGGSYQIRAEGIDL